jgi:threonine dehydrogenase-like Zn-dependent dehydrogenase
MRQRHALIFTITGFYPKKQKVAVVRITPNAPAQLSISQFLRSLPLVAPYVHRLHPHPPWRGSLDWRVLRQAFYARDLAGTVVQVGVPTPDMVMPNIPMIDFFGRGGAMKPSWYGDCLPSRDFPLLVDLHLQGRLPLEDFVTETIGLSEIEQAFHRMERGEVLRSVVVL